MAQKIDVHTINSALNSFRNRQNQASTRALSKRDGVNKAIDELIGLIASDHNKQRYAEVVKRLGDIANSVRVRASEVPHHIRPEPEDVVGERASDKVDSSGTMSSSTERLVILGNKHLDSALNQINSFYPVYKRHPKTTAATITAIIAAGAFAWSSARNPEGWLHGLLNRQPDNGTAVQKGGR